MDIFLMFSPTRTREYTRTPFDFDHDFFVKFTKLEAACTTPEGLQAVGQRVIDELKADCRFWGDMPFQLTNEWRVWRDYMPKAWNEAIGVSMARFVGDADNMPDTVYVALLKITRNIWGGGLTYYNYQALAAFANRDDADQFVDDMPDASVVEMPLTVGTRVAA